MQQKKKPNFHIDKPKLSPRPSMPESPTSPLSQSLRDRNSSFSAKMITPQQLAAVTEEVETLLQTALHRMAEYPSACRSSAKITWLLESLASIIAVSADEMKPFLSARACIVCGRDDRTGEQRKSGFKCFECVGAPSNNRFRVRVDECTALKMVTLENGTEMMNEYVLEGALGSGSYGKVRMCHHVRQPLQKYACKFMNKKELSAVLKDATQQGPTALDDVISEIEILKSIRHPSVVQIYEVIDDPTKDLLCVVMEILPGGCIIDLDDNGYAKNNDPAKLVTGDRLKKDVVSALRGLQYLHQRGIVHRDIKPDNMMYDARGNLLITDFSISQNTKKTTSLQVTASSHHATGTVLFMPPEDFAGDDDVLHLDTAKDIWGLGASLFAAAVGHVPFPARSQIEYEVAVTMTEPPFPLGMDPELRELLAGMLHKDPHERFTIEAAIQHPYLKTVRTLRGYAVESPSVCVRWEPHEHDYVLVRSREGMTAGHGIVTRYFQPTGGGKDMQVTVSRKQFSFYMI